MGCPVVGLPGWSEPGAVPASKNKLLEPPGCVAVGNGSKAKSLFSHLSLSALGQGGEGEGGCYRSVTGLTWLCPDKPEHHETNF